jgi:dihydroxyacid dehydratase/phosphogluconate dehydratase
VKTLEANGGTELLQPLKHILDSHQDQSILLITDGEISNTGKYFISLSLSLSLVLSRHFFVCKFI